MSGIIYNANCARTPLLKYSDGQIFDIRDMIVGMYDVYGDYRSIYCGSYKTSQNVIGHNKYNNGYAGYSSSVFIYAKNNHIYDSSGSLLATYDGDTSGAIAAYIVYNYMKTQRSTVTEKTPISSSYVPSTSSYTNSDSSDGNGCLLVLLAILALPIVCWLGWNINVEFWTKLLSSAIEENNWIGILGYYGVTLFCTILAAINTFKTTNNTSFFKVISETFKAVYSYINVGMMIGGIIVFLEILITHQSLFNIILVIIFIPVVYYILAFFPAVIVSVLTAILVLFKN